MRYVKNVVKHFKHFKHAGAYELRTLVQNNEIVNFAIQM